MIFADFILEQKKTMLRRETSVCIRYYFNCFVPIGFLVVVGCFSMVVLTYLISFIINKIVIERR